MGKIDSYIRLARPHQYMKNGFVFLPLFFGYKLGDPHAVWETFCAFFVFSLAASSVYIFNDIQDIDEDKRHPVKKLRPLASGKLSRTEAVFSVFFLLISSISLAVLLLPTSCLIVLGGYLLLNLFYSLGLKHVSILDITIIAFGFVLRVLAGGLAADVQPSHWIILMSFLLSLFLSLAKRRDDLLLAQRENGATKYTNGYSLEFISTGMVVMASVTIVSYILYTVSPEVVSKHNSQNLYLTSFWVILGILRFMQITFVHERSGSPTYILLRDLFLQAIIILWLFTFFILFYINGH
jgi:decaprenyl-phosphate phosphoribosyltransferase